MNNNNNNENLENHQNLEVVREILRNMVMVHTSYLNELSNYNENMVGLLSAHLNARNNNNNTNRANNRNTHLRNAILNNYLRTNNRNLNTRIFDNFRIFQNINLNNRRNLTIEEINNATETISYTEDLEEESCPISLETFLLNENICRIKECGHIFKRQPLMRWFQTDTICPVCRYDLKNYNSHNQRGENIRQNTNDNNDNNPIRPISFLNRTTRTQGLTEEINPHTLLGTNLSEQISSVISEIFNEPNNYFDTSNNTITFEFPLYYAAL